MTNFEANTAAKAVGEALVRGASEAAAGNSQDNQSRWAEIAVDSLKQTEQMQKSDLPSSGSSSHKAMEAVTNSIGRAASSGDSLSDVVTGKSSDGMTSISKEPFFKHFKEKVTDEQRKQAKESLEKDLSDLIPEKDKQALKNLQAAIIDGDLGKMQATLKELSGNPEQLKKLVNGLKKELDKNYLGIDLNMDASGNVLLYERKGSTALSITPQTGETTLRPMETQGDGSVVIKPGEIINRTPGEVLKNIGDEATRNLTPPYYGGILKGLDSAITPGSGSGKIKPFYGVEEQPRHFHEKFSRIPQELKQKEQR